MLLLTFVVEVEVLKCQKEWLGDLLGGNSSFKNAEELLLALHGGKGRLRLCNLCHALNKSLLSRC